MWTQGSTLQPGYTAPHRISVQPGYLHETLSQEDLDMTPLVKTAKNIPIAGSCARRLAKSLTFASLLLASAAAIADDLPVATQVVDLANKLNGEHPGFRAFHAKGVVVTGSFKASPEAAKHSHATIFR